MDHAITGASVAALKEAGERKGAPMNETRGEATSKLTSIERAIERAGLAPRGAVRLNDAERIGAVAPFRTLVLVGMIGAWNWDAFEQSPEARDGAPDPLDRWSRRNLDGIARLIGAEVLYPFGGPPYWPFPSWAKTRRAAVAVAARDVDPQRIRAVAQLPRRSRRCRRSWRPRAPRSASALAKPARSARA